jgi:dimethylhistidine N-methyltransferase
MSASNLAFFADLKPPKSDFRADVLEGLARPQKSIEPKYFYDQTGSELFDKITETPEYYITRTELALLDQIGPEIRTVVGSNVVVLEPGAGSSVKIRKLLDALVDPAAYVGMDISGDHVKSACKAIAEDYSDVAVGALCHDFTRSLDLSQFDLPEGRRVLFFPGSTIGNFELTGVVSLLKEFRASVRPGDGLIIGVDLRKPANVLEAAYNDAEGNTAAFNFNLVNRINSELDGTLDVSNLDYRAHWNPYRSRVEMYLQAKKDQIFSVAGQVFTLRADETIHTENSHKFTVSTFGDLARVAGWTPSGVWVSDDDAVSIHWLEFADEPC